MATRQKTTSADEIAFREGLGRRIALISDKLSSKRAAAEAAGVTAEQLNKWISGAVKVPVDGLMRLATEAGVDLSWAASGGGRGPEPDDSSGLISIPRYDVQASAGPGKVPVEETYDLVSFDRRFLRSHGAAPESCFVIEARGDSMQPTIPDGSLLIVDHSQTDIGNGWICVIGVGDAILVKRVRLRIGGAVELSSDNSAYEPEIINRDQLADLRVIGKVVYYCRVP